MSSTAVKIVKPLAITDSILTATNVSDNPPADWVSGASYAIGDEVVRPAIHKVYVSNTAHTGIATLPENDAVNWTYKSPSNDYAMFDASNSTQTVNADTIEVTLEPGTIVNTLHLANLDAVEVRLIVVDPVAGTLPTETFDLKSPIPSPSWYEWIYTTRTYKKSITIPLPSYKNASFTVEIDKTGLDAKCGTLVIGKAFSYGHGIEYGASGGIQSYSVNATDQFGNRNIVKRGYSQKTDWNVWVPENQVDGFNSLLISLRDEVTLYIGTSKYEMMSVLGFLKDFRPNITYEDYCIFNMQVEGTA